MMACWVESWTVGGRGEALAGMADMHNAIRAETYLMVTGLSFRTVPDQTVGLIARRRLTSCLPACRRGAVPMAFDLGGQISYMRALALTALIKDVRREAHISALEDRSKAPPRLPLAFCIA
jgi:hypothetical protein